MGHEFVRPMHCIGRTFLHIYMYIYIYIYIKSLKPGIMTSFSLFCYISINRLVVQPLEMGCMKGLTGSLPYCRSESKILRNT